MQASQMDLQTSLLVNANSLDLFTLSHVIYVLHAVQINIIASSVCHYYIPKLSVHSGKHSFGNIVGIDNGGTFSSGGRGSWRYKSSHTHTPQIIYSYRYLNHHKILYRSSYTYFSII